jgi:hypothetical protein
MLRSAFLTKLNLVWTLAPTSFLTRASPAVTAAALGLRPSFSRKTRKTPRKIGGSFSPSVGVRVAQRHLYDGKGFRGGITLSPPAISSNLPLPIATLRLHWQGAVVRRLLSVDMLMSWGHKKYNLTEKTGQQPFRELKVCACCWDGDVSQRRRDHRPLQ